MAIHIHQVGPLTGLQDLGRGGLMRYGITESGAMDRCAAALCWQLLAQASGASPLIEILPGGIALEVDQAVSLALVSTGFMASIDGRDFGASGCFVLRPGQRLRVRSLGGQFAYLGAAAQWALAPVMGAYASHFRSGVGYPALAVGDQFVLESPQWLPERALPALDYDDAPLRCIAGPQAERFDLEAFYAQSWRVGAHSDRMAYTLEGEALHNAGAADIVSDGIALGCIQVPGNGLPLVLLADRGTTGGYPKIATVISADLPRLVQHAPGATLRFAPCTLEQARAARLAQRDAMAQYVAEYFHGSLLSSERLLGLNLVSGVVCA